MTSSSDEKESFSNRKNKKLIIVSLRTSDDELKSDTHWLINLFTV